MLSVSEALSRVLSDFQSLGAEPVAAIDAAGRVLAESVRATLNLPPFANSSMDGYAVRAADVRGVAAHAPAALAVIGDVPAGVIPSVIVLSGTAVRIMTGAQVPDGADAVVPVEATDDTRSPTGGPLPAIVQIREPVLAGANIRVVGEDVRLGEEVLPRGTLLRPYDIGVLAAFGINRVAVVRRPRVAILGTGDELVDIDQVPAAGQIRDTNGVTLTALALKYGAEPIRLGVARDRVEDVYARLIDAVERGADVIVSSAGVSVGAYDVVKTAVERDGSLVFWKVRMRPGKPLAYGRFRGLPFFGLPGNPVSAVVGFEIFVRPAILKLAGRLRLDKPRVGVSTSEPLYSDGRESYLRAVVVREGDRYVAHSAGGQGSNMISSLARSNALVIIPEGVREAPAGSRLDAWMLDWPEEVF